MHDISDFISATKNIVASHGLGRTGAYRRWNWQNQESTRDLSLNPYGCADAANILYTIGSFPRGVEERMQWIRVLRSLQGREHEMFRESTHHEIHTTAHCIAALELFDAGPQYHPTYLSQYRTGEAMSQFLEGLDWEHNPWNESHKGAGVYAALVLTTGLTQQCKNRYFDWLSLHSDPATGLLKKGCVPPATSENVFPYLAGTFHYLFNMEYERRPLKYPNALIDTCLEIFRNRRFPIGQRVSFAEIDWVYCITRSLRQSGYRYDDCRNALVSFANEYIPFLRALEPTSDEGLNDLHMLFGALCCLAELQTALPGYILTETPLKLVLDRRPFI